MRIDAVIPTHERPETVVRAVESALAQTRPPDAVIVAEVYPAGEAPIAGVDRDHLVAALRARGHRNVIALPEPGKLAGIIKELAKPGDYVVCLGAGNITQWAYALPGELAALR